MYLEIRYWHQVIILHSGSLPYHFYMSFSIVTGTLNKDLTKFSSLMLNIILPLFMNF